MNQSAIAKIKNGKITLPKGLQKEWGTDQVIFLAAPEGLYIKPLTSPSLAALEPKLKKLGKMVSSKLIAEAVKWGKKKTYENRA